MPEQHLEKRGQSMAYKLNVTEHADELLDNLVYHLIYRLKNEQAAEHLLDSIDVSMIGWRSILFSFQSVKMHIWQRKGIGRQL